MTLEEMLARIAEGADVVIEAVGLPGTAGSRALAGRTVSSDAPLVARLRDAGAIVLGSTNLSEWANFRSPRSISGWSGVGGLTGNPWALDRSAGGSSSGSGAAVAAGLAPIAIGVGCDASLWYWFLIDSSATRNRMMPAAIWSAPGVIPHEWRTRTPMVAARATEIKAIVVASSAIRIRAVRFSVPVIWTKGTITFFGPSVRKKKVKTRAKSSDVGAFRSEERV